MQKLALLVVNLRADLEEITKEKEGLEGELVECQKKLLRKVPQPPLGGSTSQVVAVTPQATSAKAPFNSLGLAGLILIMKGMDGEMKQDDKMKMGYVLKCIIYLRERNQNGNSKKNIVTCVFSVR